MVKLVFNQRKYKMKTMVEVLGSLASHAKSFDYYKAKYTGALTPITGIVCSLHGQFQQYSSQLRKEGGAGCPACGEAQRIEARKATSKHLIEKLQSVHGAKYTYPQLEASLNTKPGSATKIECVCPIHGSFHANYGNLLSGKGCPECGSLKRGRYTKTYEVAPQAKVAAMRKAKRAETIVAEFTKVHDNFYDYSKFVYNGMRTKGVIICPVHCEFEQLPMKHVAGAGCPKCARIR